MTSQHRQAADEHRAQFAFEIAFSNGDGNQGLPPGTTAPKVGVFAASVLGRLGLGAWLLVALPGGRARLSRLPGWPVLRLSAAVSLEGGGRKRAVIGRLRTR